MDSDFSQPRALSHDDFFRLLPSEGNSTDNRDSLKSYTHLYATCVTEACFWALVFLDNHETHDLVSNGRSLRAAAKRALEMNDAELSENWNLATVKATFNERSDTSKWGPIFLRPATPGERPHGRWYIQDGSHRCLAYAMHILKNNCSYIPLFAHVASNSPIEDHHASQKTQMKERKP